MLNIQQLSFWERREYFENIDFLVIGSGIVGCATAIHLRKRFAAAKIVILERGYLPSGASTKNAGFASFGGPVELMDDLKNNDPKLVWDTVQARYEGLQYLKAIIGEKEMDFQQHGGWDIIKKGDDALAKEVMSILPYMNEEMQRITKIPDAFKFSPNKQKDFGFEGVAGLFNIQLEGQIDTGKMMKRYHQLLGEQGILLLAGIEVKELELSLKQVETNIGTIKYENICIATNGFTKQLLPDEDVLPARAQVLVTSPIEKLAFKGTFHYDFGYYYFRNFGNRILLGGARNTDILGETTYDLSITQPIQNHLKDLLSNMIVPHTDYQIAYQWSGIMGMGKSKHPIVKKITDSAAIGVRLGGIGVAMGTNIGKKMADLF